MSENYSRLVRPWHEGFHSMDLVPGIDDAELAEIEDENEHIIRDTHERASNSLREALLGSILAHSSAFFEYL